MGINDGTSHMQSQAVMDVGANGWSGSAGDPVLSSPEPFPHDAGSFSVDDWGKDATSHLHYENLSTLTPEKGYLSAIENLSVFTAACSRETYVAPPTDFDLSKLPGFNYAYKSRHPPATSPPTAIPNFITFFNHHCHLFIE